MKEIRKITALDNNGDKVFLHSEGKGYYFSPEENEFFEIQEATGLLLSLIMLNYADDYRDISLIIELPEEQKETSISV